jgi:hypothetical protein
MAAEKTADEIFAESFALISEADRKEETVSKEQLDKITPEKTPEEIAAEAKTAEDAAALKAEQDAAAAANAGKTPEQIAEEAEVVRITAENQRLAAEAAKKTAQPSQEDDALLGRLAKLVQKDASAEAAAAAEAVRQQEAARQRAPTPQMSEQDLEAYNKYVADFPDVAANEARIRRTEYPLVTRHIFNEVETYVQKRLEQEVMPYVEIIKTMAERMHLGDLKQAIPDYDKIPFDKLNEWVAAQPDYLQDGMKYVLKSGTQAQATDLLKRFQTETGLIPSKAAAVAAPDPAAAARAKAAKALAPTDSKRAGAVAAADPTDYDGAFDHFSKLLKAEDDKF